MANFTVLVTLLPTFVISSSVGGTKSRAFAAKFCQNISSSAGGSKSRAFFHKYCRQNISSTVAVAKTRAFDTKYQ